MAEVAPCNLVLDGGGVRGIALIGAIEELERRGFRPHRLLGSSAGAIVAALYAAGYRTSELVDLLAAAPIDEALDVSVRSPRAAVRRGTRLVTRRGLRSGARVEDWLRETLAARGVSTFADLAISGNTDARLRYAAHVVVSDLTAARPRILPAEAAELGTRPERFDVTTALRASIAIPFVLAPVDIVDERHDDPHVLVDGGLLNPFPIGYFDHDPAQVETIGIDLHGDELDRRRGRWLPAPTTLPGVAIRMMSSLAGARDWQRNGPDAEHRVIRVPLGHVDPIDTDAETDELLEIGRAAAATFLDLALDPHRDHADDHTNVDQADEERRR